MIIDCVSDLHGHYPKLDGGDLLIIAGDLTKTGHINEFKKFDQWLRNLQYRKKVVVAGNHDNLLQHGYQIQYGDYLQDSGTEFESLKIWGSPWTKRFPGMNPRAMAFTVDTDEELAEKWKLIPDDTNILVTHCPPCGTLDGIEPPNSRIEGSTHFGSCSLTKRMDFSPKLHVFGHIHEGYGKWDRAYFGDKKTAFVNASLVNENYEPVNKPIRVEL